MLFPYLFKFKSTFCILFFLICESVSSSSFLSSKSNLFSFLGSSLSFNLIYRRSTSVCAPLTLLMPLFLRSALMVEGIADKRLSRSTNLYSIYSFIFFLFSSINSFNRLPCSALRCSYFISSIASCSLCTDHGS